MNFAAITLPELAPILTIFVGMLGGFYVLVRFMLTLSEKTSEADRVERKELSKAITEMAKGMEAVAVSNERIAVESEKRNGHLAEIQLESKNQILDRIDGVIINKQTVQHQHILEEIVEKQVTKEK